MPLIPNAYTPDTIAIGIIAEGRARNLDDLGIVCGIAGALPESGLVMYANEGDPPSLAFPYQKLSSDKNSDGIYQQRDPWWGTAADRMDVRRSAGMFFASLVKQKNPTYHEDAGVAIANVQQPRADLRWKYGARMGDAWAIFNRLKGAAPQQPAATGSDITPEPGFAGDPHWLADVLRAEGLNVVEMDGWQDRGEGDQGVLWGAVFHHTGNVNETPEGIAFHPDLGLAAHLLIRPDGTVYVCGIGKANHAGVGSWVGIETDNANEVTIGVEVAILPVEDAPHRSGWPDDQYFATVKTMAAILRKLAHQSDRVISHKEWATLGPAGWRQGKWDPGAIDMNIFRSDVAAQIDSHTPTSGDDVPLVTQPSGSIYRESNKNLDWAGTPMDFIMDAQIHEGRVETLAIQGVPKALALVQAVADGTSPVSDSLNDDAVAQAQAILDVIAAQAKKTARAAK